MESLAPNVAAGPDNATSTAYEASRVVHTKRVKLIGFTIYNSKATTQFVQFHNAAALPADGAVPSLVFPVAGASVISFDAGAYGRVFPLGMVVCNSSTGPTKTIGSADLWIDVQYVTS
jgi:hypothetical protein